MPKHLALIFLATCCLMSIRALGDGGYAHFDLSKIPGTYVARTRDVQVQLKIEHPEILKQALDSDPPDSSPNPPTMDTDDGETLGPHAVEIDLVTNCERSVGDKYCSQGIDTIFGVGKHLQFDVNRSVTRDQQDGMPATTNKSATNIGGKYNMLDKNGWAVAVYPALSLNDATPARNDDGTFGESDGHILTSRSWSQDRSTGKRPLPSTLVAVVALNIAT